MLIAASLVLGAGLVFSSAPGRVTTEDEAPVEAEARPSLELSSVDELWGSSGFRVDIGYAFILLEGLGKAPDLMLHGVSVRPGLRLTEEWLLHVALVYGFDPSQGIHWAVTLEPSWNVWAGLGISIGFGYAGLIRTAQEPTQPPAFPEAPETPVSPSPRFDRDTTDFTTNCDGDGAIATIGVNYTFNLASLFATGPFVRGFGFLTSCARSLGDINPETGLGYVERHNWTYFGGQFGWWLSWR